MDLFNMKGKTILITGGYGYLGSAISAGLAEYEANVCVLGRSQQKFNDIFGENRTRIEFIKCDISQTASVREAISIALNKYGSVDVLINNAMYSRGADPLNISDEDWQYTLEGVLGSTYRCIREVSPLFKNQKGGNIINIASMYGLVSPDFSVYLDAPEFLNPPHYGAAKAAVLQITRYFAQYLGPWGIRVNSITPGPFPNVEAQKNNDFVTALANHTSLQRFGQPEELIGAAVYLSSKASSYVTGQNVIVDGGWTAR